MRALSAASNTYLRLPIMPKRDGLVARHTIVDYDHRRVAFRAMQAMALAGDLSDEFGQ
jgi:hypothetical protein